MSAAPDIRAENHGSLWLVRGRSEPGQAWLQDNVAFEHFFGGAGVVEWRYIQDILTGARQDGLQVEIDS
jgi:hypothetical protein